MPSFDQASLEAHLKYRGKIATLPKGEVTPESLPLFYTPGVGAVSRHLAEHPEETKKYTLAGNTVAVVSDGSAVLGLGNIGPEGALPVMEGKAMLFKSLGDVDAFPIVLNTQDPEKIVEIVAAMAPGFAGINLEDIAAPRCYEIENKLQERLDIPVMHDDQHATAIVTLAGLINACKVTGRNLKTARIVILGAGAGASGTARLLHAYGAEHIILTDSKGIIAASRSDLDSNKQDLASFTNGENRTGSLADALPGADIVIGLASANLLRSDDIGRMRAQSIVFALSNPTPEIMPDVALAAGAAVVATGRSDFPNQINNVLVFPGIFRGALDHGVRKITTEIKLKAAQGLADLVEKPTPEHVIPSVFDERVVPTVAATVGA